MRIAVPTQEGVFCPHFGRCDGVWLCEFDTEAGKAERPRIVQRPQQGCDSLPRWLQELAVELVVAGGIGGGAMERLASLGIAVSAGHAGDDFQALLQSYRAHPDGRSENACSGEHHDRHHCKH